MSQICECCFEAEGEQFLQSEGMWVCNDCVDGIMKGNLVKIEQEVQGGAVDVMPAKPKKKDNRMTVRLTETDLKMVDFIKGLYTDIKLEMTDSEVLRLALREMATDRGFKDGSSG